MKRIKPSPLLRVNGEVASLSGRHPTVAGSGRLFRLQGMGTNAAVAYEQIHEITAVRTGRSGVLLIGCEQLVRRTFTTVGDHPFFPDIVRRFLTIFV